MKKLILAIVLIFAISGVNAQTFDKTEPLKTGSVTLNTLWQAIPLGTGTKSLVIKNSSGAVVWVCFPNGNYKKDSTNYDIQANGTAVRYSQLTSDSIFVKGSGSSITYDILRGTGAEGYNIIDGVDNLTDLSSLPFSGRDTVNGVPDSLSRLNDLADTCDTMSELGYTSWFQCLFATDDTIMVSESITFPANKTWYVYPSEAWTSEKYNISGITTNLYWKVSGSGTATVRRRMFGL